MKAPNFLYFFISLDNLQLKEMALGHGGTGVCFISALCTIQYEETAWAQWGNEYPCLLNAH